MRKFCEVGVHKSGLEAWLTADRNPHLSTRHTTVSNKMYRRSQSHFRLAMSLTIDKAVINVYHIRSDEQSLNVKLNSIYSNVSGVQEKPV